MDRIKFAELRNAAEKAAVMGGKEALKIYSKNMKKNIKAWMKSEREVVTVTDRKVQELIKSFIARKFPEHGFVGEEDIQHISGNNNSKTKAKIRTESLPEFRWIVDPIDGTANFAKHIPCWCCSVACEYSANERTNNNSTSIVAAAVYDPVHNELFSADAGSVSAARLNGNKISVSKNSLKSSLVCVAAGFENKDIMKYSRYIGPINASCNRIRDMGSMALEFCYIASGRVDAAVKVRQHYWDFAAAALIVEKAGGTVTDLDRRKITPQTRDLVASNSINHKELLSIIQKYAR